MSPRQADARMLAITALISVALYIDQTVPLWGQVVADIVTWFFFLRWLRESEPEQQLALSACVAYATLGEIFLSLGWGLYEYRLGNIPLFVPPGHALLFMLGNLIAARMRDWISWFVPAAAAPFVGLLIATGVDTFGALLFGAFLLCCAFGTQRRLYAVMFILSLAMEIYGTWLGNWRWMVDVPWIGLTTVNPPLASGAFYCMLDLLVVQTLAARRRAAARLAAQPAT